MRPMLHASVATPVGRDCFVCQPANPLAPRKVGVLLTMVLSRRRLCWESRELAALAMVLVSADKHVFESGHVVALEEIPEQPRGLAPRAFATSDLL